VDKKPLIVVSICAVVLLVLGSLSNVVGYQTVQSSNEKVTIKISYSTLRGVEQVEKEVSLQDSHRLSILMHGSDNEALADELMKLGLVPSSMNSKQLKELISGDYGKRECVRYNKVLNGYLGTESSNGIKRNYLCTVQGESLDYIYLAALELLLFGLGWKLVDLGIYLADKYPSIFPIIHIPFIYGSISLLDIVGFSLMDLANILYLFRISKIRAVPILFSNICDGAGNQKTNLSTRGLLGTWSIQSHDINMILIGFLGVWITIPDAVNSPGCSFRGFSLYAAACDIDY